MSETAFDFAVFGSTPLAHVLAGLLAGTHGRRVLLVGESQAGYRLPRGLDLSIAPITRPESWAILTRTLAETTRLVGRIAGRAAISRVDPIFFAEGQHHGEALSHMRHMAQGFGIAAEPVAPSLIGGARSGVVMRDAIRINRPALEAGLKQWLDQAAVQRIRPSKVTISSEGEAEIAADGSAYSARQAVLADDEAIMAWLPLRQWPQTLRRLPYASILTTPTRPLAASIMLELNSGIFLTQQAEGGIAAFGPGDLSGFSGHIQALLGRDRQVEQAGQTGFKALVTPDGAPVFGRAAGTGADVVAGLGCLGVFLAPALARWMTGQATAAESEWFEARLVNRSGKGVPVNDHVPGAGGMPA